MTAAIFQAKPEDPIAFMIKYLKENHGNRASINQNQRSRLDFLRKEVERLKHESGTDAETHDGASGSEHESDESDEDDYVDELPEQLLAKRKQTKGRVSVSAEAYGEWNKKEDFKATVVPKSEAVKQKIRDRLAQSFMFSALEEKDLTIVIDAMKEVAVKEGEIVIK